MMADGEVRMRVGIASEMALVPYCFWKAEWLNDSFNIQDEDFMRFDFPKVDFGDHTFSSLCPLDFSLLYYLFF